MKVKYNLKWLRKHWGPEALDLFEAELREKYKEHKEVGSIGADIIAEVYKEILGDE